jgi:hypothetical protein
MSAPTETQTPSADTLTHIQSEPVIWIRLAAVRREEEWTASLLEMTSGGPPPDWEPREWEYPEVLLVAFQLNGAQAAESLRQGQLNLAGRIVSMPEVSTQNRWDRHQSGHIGTYQPLDWPVYETQLIMTAGPQNEPQGHLVSAGEAPSFINFYTAARSFFWLGGTVVGGAINPGAIYRHQDLRARIRRVRIAADFVEVEVEGHTDQVLTVELPGDMPGPASRIWMDETKPHQTARFDLPDRLAPGTWVLLRRGDRWIDRRFLAYPWARGNEVGIEYEVDPVSRLEALIAARERDQVEYKRKVPEPGDGRERLMKAVCSFANGMGGSVLIGVDDDREIFGVAPGDVDRISRQLTQMVGSWIEPRPVVTFNELNVQDTPMVVLEMWVEPPTDALCGSGRPGETKTAYVRRHSCSEKATIAEIKAILETRSSRMGISSFNAFA